MERAGDPHGVSRGPNMGSGGRWCSADSVEEMGGALAAHCDVTNSTGSNAPGLFTVRANLHLTEMLENKVEREKSEVVTFWWLLPGPSLLPAPIMVFLLFVAM